MEKHLSKTPIAARFRTALDIANDVTCFQLFIHERFGETATQAFERTQARIASEAFPENEHAERVDLALNPLIELGLQSADWGVVHGLMISIEHVLSYCDEARALVSKYRTTQPAKDGELGPEENLRHVMEQCDLRKKIDHTFKTATYFRHIRNHIAHARTTPVSTKTNFNRQNANDLNYYWSGKPAKLNNFDFASFDVSRPLFPEILAAISVLRITLMELDECVAQCLPLAAVLMDVREDIMKNAPHLMGSSGKVLKKIKGTIEMEFGLKMRSKEISEHLNQL